MKRHETSFKLIQASWHYDYGLLLGIPGTPNIQGNLVRNRQEWEFLKNSPKRFLPKRKIELNLHVSSLHSIARDIKIKLNQRIAILFPFDFLFLSAIKMIARFVSSPGRLRHLKCFFYLSTLNRNTYDLYSLDFLGLLDI